MDQFIVPQFIDVEDKIIGPITTRQFIIMIVALIFLVVAYKLFDLSLFILTALLVAGLVALFGFYKVNGRPFHHFLSAACQAAVKPNLRIWNKASPESMGENEATVKTPTRTLPVRHVSRTRLAELALIVDTGGVYEGEEYENSKSSPYEGSPEGRQNPK